MTKDRQTAAIAELNDLFRTQPENYGQLGRHVHTAGIHALPIMDQYIIAHMVGAFDAFNGDNDPHGEHDFGAIEYRGQKIFLKIDYYNLTPTGGSEDPADWKNTIRVLTTMLASEY